MEQSIVDSLGRSIKNDMGSDDIAALVKSLQSDMKSQVKMQQKTVDAGKKMEKVAEILSSASKSFQQGAADARKWAETVIGSMKQSDGKSGQGSNVDKKVAKSIIDLHKHATKKSSIYTRDVQLKKVVKEMHKDLVKCLCGSNVNIQIPKVPRTGGGGGGGSRSGGGGGGTGSGGNSGGGQRGGSGDNIADVDLDDLYFLSQLIRSIETQIYKVEKAFLGFNTLDTIFGGIIDKETQFIRDSRQVAHEIAGVTGEARTLQKAYEDIGKTVSRTGMNRTETQEAYLSALRKGIKDQNKALDVSVSQLHTATMIGVEGKEMGETFVDWHNQMRLNTGQLGDMSRGVRDIARYTGMTGKNLLEVVKSGEEMIRTFRNAATLTAASAKNVLEISANAKKLGIDQQLSPLVKAMSSTANLMTEASSQTKGLLYLAAGSMNRISDLQSGVILRSKEGIRDMAQGMKNVLRQFGVSDINKIDQLSDIQKRNINLQLKGAFGLELGEVRQVLEAMEEAGKTAAMRLEGIEKKRKQNLTLEEKAALMEEERRVKTSAALEAMTAIDEAAKGADNMAAALAKFGTRRNEFEENLGALGVNWTTDIAAARGTLESAINSVNENLSKQGLDKLSIDSGRIEKVLKSQSPEAFRELTSEISKAQEKADIEAKKDLDPMSKTNHILTEINENIRDMNQGIISSIMSSFAGLPLVMGTAISAVVLGLGAKFTSFAVDWKQLSDAYNKKVRDKDLFKKLNRFNPMDKIRGNVDKPGDFLKGKTDPLFDLLGEKGAGLFESIGKKGNKFFRSLKDSFSRGARFNRYINLANIGLEKLLRSTKDFFYLALDQFKNLGNRIKSIFSKQNLKIAGGAVKKGTITGAKGILNAIKSVFYGGINGLKNIWRGGFEGMMSMAANLWKGGFKTIARIWKGGFAGLKALILGGTLGTAQIIFSTIDAIIGAFTGFTKTGEDFRYIAQEMNGAAGELTWGMYASSTAGGLLVGVLDGLTFGLLGMLGIAEPLRKGVTMISYLFFSAIEGMVDGLMWGLSIVKPAWTYLKKQFSNIGDAFVRIANSILSIFGKDGEDAFKNFSEVFAAIYKVIKPIAFVLGAIVGLGLGAVLWVVVKALSFVVAILETAINVIAGVVQVLSRFIKLLWSIATFDVDAMKENFLGLFTDIRDGIYDIFSPLVSWIGSIGTDISNAFGDFPSMIYDGFVSALTKVWEWIKSWIPGTIQNATQGYTESSVEQAATYAQQGPSFSHGVGGIFGGSKELLKGNFSEAAYKVYGGASETLSSLNPFNYFDEGTRHINKSGLAMLHQGEMVVPSDLTRNISAEGNGPFSSGIFGSDIFDNAFDIADKMFGISAIKDIIAQGISGSIPDVETANIVDVHERVKREHASSKSGVGSTSDMSRLAASNDAQVMLQSQMVDLLSTMISMMSPGQSGPAESPDNSSRYVAQKPPSYFKWVTGKHNQGADKNVTNIGSLNL